MGEDSVVCAKGLWSDGHVLAACFVCQLWVLYVWTKASAAWAEVWPAGEVEQLVLVADRGFVLQLPHQHVDQVGVFDNDGHLFKHVLEADASLLQAEGVGREEKGKKMTLSGRTQPQWHESSSFSAIST